MPSPTPVETADPAGFHDAAPPPGVSVPRDTISEREDPAPNRLSTDVPPVRGAETSESDPSFGDDAPPEAAQPAAPDPGVPRYADGTPLDPRAPRFKDGTPVEVEMLQGTHPEHLAQFVSVAPGNYAILVKGKGYARAGNNGLYAFDMRAHMEGRETEPWEGIPFFGWGADIDVDAMLASDGIVEFADEAEGNVDEPGGGAPAGTPAAPLEDGTPSGSGAQGLAALTDDQRAIANALINNGANSDAAILQARELIHSEGDVIPADNARPELLQRAASGTDGDNAPGRNPVLEGAGYRFVEGVEGEDGHWVRPDGTKAAPGELRERVTKTIRERAEKEGWSVGRILRDAHKSRSGLPPEEREKIQTAMAALAIPIVGTEAGAAMIASVKALLISLGLIGVLSGDTPQNGNGKTGDEDKPDPSTDGSAPMPQNELPPPDPIVPPPQPGAGRRDDPSENDPEPDEPPKPEWEPSFHLPRRTRSGQDFEQSYNEWLERGGNEIIESRDQARKSGRQVPKMDKGESFIWYSLRNDRVVQGQQVKTNGLPGKRARYYQWDFGESEIEVYIRRGNKLIHIGVMDPATGKMIKPAKSSRIIEYTEVDRDGDGKATV